MKITEIIVEAGRTFNHPHESYSNLKPSVTLRATLDDDESADLAVKELQKRAEGLVEDHKQGLLRSIEELYQLSEHQAEVRGLEQQLRRAQERLEEIRNGNPGLRALPETTVDNILKESNESTGPFEDIP